MLYIAATFAIRCNPASKALYDRLIAKGREHKVAVVAGMRPLVTLVNALLRDDRMWQPQPAAEEAIACIPPRSSLSLRGGSPPASGP